MKIDTLTQTALTGSGIDPDTALGVLQSDPADFPALLSAAAAVRRRFFKNRVYGCSIVNIKSGNCSEDCAFCAQSVSHRAPAPIFPLIEEPTLHAAAEEAWRRDCPIGLVSSGKNALTGPDFETLLRSIRTLSKKGPVHASFGLLDASKAQALKKAGVTVYNHNLETAQSHFPALVSTHGYDDRLQTVRTAREAGLTVCCGGILGAGESPEQRVELAFALKQLAVDIVPLNFLHPIAGTPLEKAPPLSPLDCLRTVIMFRLVLPPVRINVCGGREHNLRDLQALLFMAGATGILVGNYLTTFGRPARADLAMIRDLEMELAAHG